MNGCGCLDLHPLPGSSRTYPAPTDAYRVCAQQGYYKRAKVRKSLCADRLLLAAERVLCRASFGHSGRLELFSAVICVSTRLQHRWETTLSRGEHIHGAFSAVLCESFNRTRKYTYASQPNATSSRSRCRVVYFRLLHTVPSASGTVSSAGPRNKKSASSSPATWIQPKKIQACLVWLTV